MIAFSRRSITAFGVFAGTNLRQFRGQFGEPGWIAGIETGVGKLVFQLSHLKFRRRDLFGQDFQGMGVGEIHLGSVGLGQVRGIEGEADEAQRVDHCR